MLGFASGCGSDAILDRSGITLEISDDWDSVDVSTVVVPGTALAVWQGPEGASLVIYRTLPIPGGTAEGLAEQYANRLTNMPGLTIERRGVERIADQELAWVELIAPGFGNALAPTGSGEPYALEGKTLVPTRRVTLATPRPGDTIWLEWHYPETARATLQPKVEAACQSLRIASSASSLMMY